MNISKNSMTLNDKDIGISKIELNKCDLLVTDKSGKYCLKVYLLYNWKDINNIKIGQKRKIDFNEYCFSENNEPALIWPVECLVEKISDTSLYFYLSFNDLENETTYMNSREHFDIKLKSLKVKVLIDDRDAVNGSIIYNF